MKKSSSRAEAAGEESAHEGFLDQIDLEVAPRVDGIVLGTLAGLDEAGAPLVTFPGSGTVKPAMTTVPIVDEDIGRQVALMFAQGAASRPVVLGLIQNPKPMTHKPAEVTVDGKHIVLDAKDEIVLRCGKASITLAKSGKIVVKGTHLVNRSSGLNKIKGAAVNIN